MDYRSVRETAENWGISVRRVQKLCEQGRVPGAQRFGQYWMIPADAEKPADPRREKNTPENTLSADLSFVIAATTVPMPNHDPDAILDIVEEECLRLQYEAELAYLRGDFERVMHCYERTAGDGAARLRASPVAIAAAISLGNYRAYIEIETYLKACIEANPDSDIAAIAELALATAAVSVYAPNMVPEWLKTGDFSALPVRARPDAHYLRAKYFHCVNRLDAMLATAQTALTLCTAEGGITVPELYLRVTCAVACHALGDEGGARRFLMEAMRLALPHGFITPFAEIITAIGGLMEQCLKREFPGSYDAVIGQWQRTWKNWIAFHNQFTKDNITLMLTLREYHIALLVAHRTPYTKIAKQQNISVGRLKNIMRDVYDKLCISGRSELAKLIL